MKITPPPDDEETPTATPEAVADADWWMIAEASATECCLLAEVAIWWPKLHEIRVKHTC